jgi:hypothetical protein
MKTQTLLATFMLVVLAGFVGGCHHGSHHDRRDYGSRSGSYQEGYRDGRAVERRRDDLREGRYYDRGDWRRRW